MLRNSLQRFVHAGASGGCLEILEERDENLRNRWWNISFRHFHAWSAIRDFDSCRRLASTYWYLETTPELLRDIAVVTENFVQGARA
jgi:hypothetical protein